MQFESPDVKEACSLPCLRHGRSAESVSWDGSDVHQPRVALTFKGICCSITKLNWIGSPAGDLATMASTTEGFVVFSESLLLFREPRASHDMIHLFCPLIHC